jgi:hypothetical protein
VSPDLYSTVLRLYFRYINDGRALR